MLATAHFEKPLLTTPFHARARAASQRDRFIAWAGYSTVEVFTSVEREYFAIRNSASLYDLTPMVKYRVRGTDAARYLNRLVTRDITRLAIGRVAYVAWCNDAGEIIDDGTLFRLSESEYRLCTAERQLDWLLAAAIGFDVEITDVTPELAALSLQGPTACAVLRAAGLGGIERLRPFEFATFPWPGTGVSGARVAISRTGFTADLGYELWMDPELAEPVWDALMRAGLDSRVRPIGSAALDIARIEAGFLQPGVDFVNAERTLRVGTARTPLELDLAWIVDFDKGHFSGRRALLAQRRSGLRRRLVGLDVQGIHPARDALLYADRRAKRRIGHVTSATWSPTCKRNIALAFVDAPHEALGGSVWAEIYLNRERTWERRMVPARIVERGFFVHERRRATPPADT